MKSPDLDRERSEQSRSLADFLKEYNANLPESFPRASVALLQEFKSTYGGLFVRTGEWSLDQHRKKVMDWLTSRKVPLA